MRYISSLSYGKDSIAMLEAIRILGLPLTDIYTVEVWFDRETPADIPEVFEFKKKVDKWILDEFGLEVIKLNNLNNWRYATFYEGCLSKNKKTNNHVIKGFPGMRIMHWCNSMKIDPMEKFGKETKGSIHYIGYAFDEIERMEKFAKNKNNVRFPLIEIGWKESDCMEFCKKNGLLSPSYELGTRDGCWFCPFATIDYKRNVRKRYPELWEKLLNLDIDISNNPHKSNEYLVRHSIMDLDKRFQMEDEGLIRKEEPFRWSMLNAVQLRLDLDE